MLEIAGLCKWYGRALAVNRFDLTVGRGEVVAFMGHNGAGKSSLIRILATLSHFDRGKVRFAGRDLRKNLNFVRRQTGVVLHEPLLYGRLSVRENLVFTARMFGFDDVNQRVFSALELLGLGDVQNQAVRSLSNGMRKRTSIARAILHAPALLLLDEVETGLDRDGIALLTNLINQYRQADKTVIIASHNAEFLETLCERLVVFDGGNKYKDVQRPTPANWRGAFQN